MLPGFISPRGSKAAFVSLKAWNMVGPNTRSRNGLRARPSPCSLEIAPPNESTRSKISSAMTRTCSSPRSVLRLIRGRMCRHPTEQWP
jgi:hypothetical protein